MNLKNLFLTTLFCCAAGTLGFASTASAQCTNTCDTAYDSECDDGGPGSMYSICALGTDCAECGPRAATMCTNTCASSNDNECDDGGPGSMYSICEFGTDCNDCGPRN